MYLPLIALVLFVFTTLALAADGVLEINQTCAVETGCFPGDSPGFPVELNETGSYQLTSNLVVPDENTGAIRFFASDIGLDLNGFAILGPVVCTGRGNCTPDSGSGVGVGLGGGATIRGFSLRNGTIRGMGSAGTNLGDRAEAVQVQAISNGGSGINVGVASLVSDCIAYQNGGQGIDASNVSVLSGNVAYLNGGDGIQAAAAGTIKKNSSSTNGGDGIQCSQGCMVRDNVVRENSGYGLNLSASAAYGANNVQDNTAGTVNGGTNVLLNVCDGASAPACP